MTTIRMSSMLDRNIIASDGAVGALYDIYFSDDTWVVEHIILQTGAFFESRRLIMDPGLLLAESGIDGGSTTSDILVATTRKEILASPDYMADPPVSEQRSHDAALHPRFLWFPTGDMTKVVLRPLGADEDALTGSSETSIAEGHNPRLQSFREVRGYAVHTATDEEEEERADQACIGHVADLLFTRQISTSNKSSSTQAMGRPVTNLWCSPALCGVSSGPMYTCTCACPARSWAWPWAEAKSNLKELGAASGRYQIITTKIRSARRREREGSVPQLRSPLALNAGPV